METGSTIYIDLPHRVHIDACGCNIRVFHQLKIAYRTMISMHEVLSMVVGRNRSQRIGMNSVEGIASGMGMKDLNSINV